MKENGASPAILRDVNVPLKKTGECTFVEFEDSTDVFDSGCGFQSGFVNYFENVTDE